MHTPTPTKVASKKVRLTLTKVANTEVLSLTEKQVASREFCSLKHKNRNPAEKYVHAGPKTQKISAIVCSRTQTDSKPEKKGAYAIHKRGNGCHPKRQVDARTHT